MLCMYVTVYCCLVVILSVLKKALEQSGGRDTDHTPSVKCLAAVQRHHTLLIGSTS